MARLKAKGTTCPQVLQGTVSRLVREFEQRYDAWQATYPNFKERLAPPQRARLKHLGGTLWRFDLRFRWAIGITSLEFDDRIVTKAATAPTRQGYFLLMRLVDLWFSLDLAFDMYRALLVPKHIAHPSVLQTLQRDGAKGLRAVKAAEQAAVQVLKRHLPTGEKRARFVGYLQTLAEDCGEGLACRFTAEAASLLERAKRLETHHLLGIAHAIRNRYVHGGETASTGTFPAQEKAPILRLLTGTAQVACLALANAAADEIVKQLRRQVGIR